jgi:UDP-N-acetylmuramoylalanine--D-glutamate ligase
MHLEGKHILIVGLARTGIAAARFLLGRGAVVRATDAAAEAGLGPAVRELREKGLRLDLGAHPLEAFAQAELIVLSPGVPHTLAPLAQARARGVAVISEIELASRFIAAPIVAISGTNGKTTVTELVGRMLEASGKGVFVGGNIGNPLIGCVDASPAPEVVVAEVSSFQLDTIATFRPAVGVLLNITADHLDRYPDLSAYAASKMRLFENQGPSDIAVLNGSDPVIAARAGTLRSRTLYYHTPDPQGGCAAVSGGVLTVRLPGATAVGFDLGRFGPRGPHNAENAAAAAIAALAAGASPAGVQRALDTFTGLPHRLEPVGTVAGVAYVNDSKATNIDAVARALECFEAPVVLIMGGRDKGGEFERLAPAVGRHAKALIVIGAAREKIRAALGRTVPTRTADGMGPAVRLAASLAAPGETVLLAPGCASFDAYADYRARGEDFRRVVKSLTKGKPR